MTPQQWQGAAAWQLAAVVGPMDQFCERHGTPERLPPDVQSVPK